MKLFTNHNFAVVRQIPDLNDATTYFVQAVIRNAYTDVIIATLNLDSKGSQRYSKTWKIPADPSGEGFYVSIVTSVYTDSGYTTKSTTWGADENTYLVVDNNNIKNGSGNSGIGMGGGLAMRDVRDIVSEELNKILPQITPKEVEPLEITMPESIDYTPQLIDIRNSIDSLKESIPSAQNFDLSSVILNLKTIEGLINAIDIPELDLTPVLNELKDTSENSDLTARELKDTLVTAEKSIISGMTEAFNKSMKNINFATTFVTTANLEGARIIKQEVEDPEEVKPKDSPVDISKLSI